MKFVGDFIQDEKGARVGFIHNMPLDPVHGLGKSVQELQQMGALVADIPDPVPIEGKVPVLYYNPSLNEVYYEYIDRPLTDQEKIEQLEQAILEMTTLLGGGN